MLQQKSKILHIIQQLKILDDCKCTKKKTTMTEKERNELYKPLRSLDTGDILLYRTKDLGAQFNAIMQSSTYSHISVVVCGDPAELNEMYPDDYKESPPTSELAIFEAVPTRGVTLFPLEARLARTISNISLLTVRRHRGIITPQNRDRLDGFMKEVMGKPLEMATMDMARSLFFNKYRGKLGKGNMEEDWDEFFCSELVGEALQQLGIIRDRGVNSNNLIPSSFAERKNHGKTDPGRTLHFAERIEMPNHSYGPEEVLIESGCPLKQELKARKKKMKEEYDSQRSQKSSQASNLSSNSAQSSQWGRLSPMLGLHSS